MATITDGACSGAIQVMGRKVLVQAGFVGLVTLHPALCGIRVGKIAMDRRITGGLAWAGLLLVLAVPSADLISQRFSSGSALSVNPAEEAAPKKVATADVKPVKPAEKTPVADTAPVPKRSKPMPSYISDGKSGETVQDVTGTKPQAAAKPAVVQTPTRVIPGAAPAVAKADEPKVVISAPTSKAPVTIPAPAQVASVEVNPMVVPPIPMPASMRPVSRPRQTDAVQTGAITTVNQSGYGSDEIVTSDELADWESGPLEEFLAQRRKTGSTQAQSGNYDPNGYYLSDGPNGNRRDREQVFPFAYN